MSAPDEELLREALRSVIDPEAGMNIVDLGLIYGIEADEQGVQVELTMTSAACPMADLIARQVQAVLEAAVPQGTPVEVRIVWDPPWTPERMSELAREHFGWAPR